MKRTKNGRITKEVISIVFILTLIFSVLILIFNPNKIYAVQNQTVNADINGINDVKYPGIKERIKLLQSKYPNWNFKILYTGLDWNDVIKNEYVGHESSPKNLVYKSSNYQGAWICAICGDKAYDNGSWRCVSEQGIKYMMDPRNSINASDIFQFEELTNSGSDINIVKSMVKSTFLEGHEQEIINSANQNNVNAYFIVARIIQEQGAQGSVLSKGEGYNGQYVGYYNLFNIGAAGNSQAEIITNGLKTAQNKGWNSIEKSINGGISFLANNYINKGQNALYLQKFDVEATNGLYSNQYMQNIMAAESEGMALRDTYIKINSMTSSHTFIIPVYENMPNDACPRPNTNETSTTDIDIVKVNVEQTLRIRNNPNGNATVGWLYKDETVTRIEKATSKVGGTYWDKVRKANGVEGYVARETFEGEANYKLYLVPVSNSNNNNNTNNNNNNNENANTTYEKGDVNGDGRIDSYDALLILKSCVGLETINDLRGDVNNDGRIDSYDALLILKYCVGLITKF